MDFFSILTMLGGLALFLYGMDAMGQGLSRLSGGKMKRLLGKLTSNKIMAVLLGTGVTAVIQSSSATTVMVVGFVNAGLMKLSQAVGVIMGAKAPIVLVSRSDSAESKLYSIAYGALIAKDIKKII